MTGQTVHEFGKRTPPRPQEGAPRKRSNHVALLLMGTMALGGGAYALMPSEKCDPNRPGVSSALPGEPDACAQRGSSSSTSHSSGGGGGGSSSRSNFASSDASSGGSSGGSTSSSSHVSRGGFGSFMSHFSGGG